MDPVTVEEFIPRFGDMEANVRRLAREYAAAYPFPHAVFDDFLDVAVFKAAVAEFPPVDEAFWTNYLHVNSRKHGNTHAETWPTPLRNIAVVLTSDRFVEFIERLTGHDELVADWSMDGGGLHASRPGGFLNIHTDFTSHHTNHHWRRSVNVLVYLNETWLDGWGGDLQFWSADMKRCDATIAPVGNRVVVFTTDERSLHGHPDAVACPDGLSRQSMALYYFRPEPRPPRRSTTYRPRPGEGPARAAAIYLDTKALRLYDIVKRRFRLPDDAASTALSRLQKLRNRVGRRRS